MTVRSRFIGAGAAAVYLTGFRSQGQRIERGVSARLMDPDIVAQARIRHPDGVVSEQDVD
jgi:hypothetical protein